MTGQGLRYQRSRMKNLFRYQGQGLSLNGHSRTLAKTRLGRPQTGWEAKSGAQRSLTEVWSRRESLSGGSQYSFIACFFLF